MTAFQVEQALSDLQCFGCLSDVALIISESRIEHAVHV